MIFKSMNFVEKEENLLDLQVGSGFLAQTK
jgi:hypothetical protein